ncbi:MAG: TerB N-terminal domain-containing protein [Sphaerochaeta sp.]|nr:TerB N-terminal domain-containing protein [Sphaerochaeta sp.]
MQVYRALRDSVMRSIRSHGLYLAFLGLLSVLLVGCSNTSALTPSNPTSTGFSGETEKHVVSEGPQPSSSLLPQESRQKTQENVLPGENPSSGNDLVATTASLDASSHTLGAVEPMSPDNQGNKNHILPGQYSDSTAKEVVQDKTMHGYVDISAGEEFVAENQINTSMPMDAPQPQNIKSGKVSSQPVSLLPQIAVAQALPPTSAEYIDEYGPLPSVVPVEDGQTVSEFKAEVEKLLLLAEDDEKQTETKPDPSPSTQEAVSAAPDPSSGQNETAPSATLFGLAASSDTTARNPLLYLFVLMMLALMVFVSRKNTLKKRNNEGPLLQKPGRTRVRTMPHSNRDDQEYPHISITLPENSNRDPDGMYTARIDEEASPVREYKIPGIPHQKADVSGFIHWIPSGKRIELNGYCIDGGMFYIGSKVRGASDPSFINTSKPITSFDDYHADHMGYWPNYSEISADARGAYLAWLAHGKDDPAADPGYVFLFFYGLERRILIDYQEGMVGEEEIRQIKCEVERLLSIYGARSNSIRRYASSFLNLLLIFESGEKNLYEEPIPGFYEEGYIPLYLKILLGQCAHDEIPMPPEAAYIWAMHDPSLSKKTPVKRCGSEFKELFMLRYALHFGEGIRLPQNKTRLQPGNGKVFLPTHGKNFNQRAVSSF